MQNQLSELQGEVLALRCFLAALVMSMPVAVHLRAWPEFDRHADLVRGGLGSSAADGFERTFTSLKSREAFIPPVSTHPSVAANLS